LRFDFSHNRALSSEQIRRIERRVNEMILSNEPSVTESMTVEQAKRAGAIGLFEAKYGERVRVIRIGGESLELCGGTHVERAGDIGLFALLSQASIAQGVRRVEAVTGMGALEHLQNLVQITGQAMAQLHVGRLEELPFRLEKIQAEMKAKDRDIERLTQKVATGGADLGDEWVDVDGVKLLAREVAVADPKALRSAADTLRDRLGSGVVVLGAQTEEGKATLLVAVTKDLSSKVHAGKLVGALAGHVDGRGGGRPDFAQAGGPKLAGLGAALAAAKDALANQLRA
jgi:alanyl-tRNA synthetase